MCRFSIESFTSPIGEVKLHNIIPRLSNVDILKGMSSLVRSLITPPNYNALPCVFCFSDASGMGPNSALAKNAILLYHSIHPINGYQVITFDDAYFRPLIPGTLTTTITNHDIPQTLMKNTVWHEAYSMLVAIKQIVQYYPEQPCRIFFFNDSSSITAGILNYKEQVAKFTYPDNILDLQNLYCAMLHDFHLQSHEINIVHCKDTHPLIRFVDRFMKTGSGNLSLANVNCPTEKIEGHPQPYDTKEEQISVDKSECVQDTNAIVFKKIETKGNVQKNNTTNIKTPQSGTDVIAKNKRNGYSDVRSECVQVAEAIAPNKIKTKSDAQKNIRLLDEIIMSCSKNGWRKFARYCRTKREILCRRIPILE